MVGGLDPRYEKRGGCPELQARYEKRCVCVCVCVCVCARARCVCACVCESH